MEAHLTNNTPWSEQYHAAARDWVEKEAAADLLEQSKSAVMAQRQSMLGEMPINRAEQYVKSSPEWQEYIEKTVGARKEANFAKVKMEYMRMKFQESMSNEANQRTEAKLMS